MKKLDKLAIQISDSITLRNSITNMIIHGGLMDSELTLDDIKKHSSLLYEAYKRPKTR